MKNQVWCIQTIDGKFTVCPICATPRPVEKTLEAKFREYLRQPRTVDYELWADDLKDIAEEHYRGKS